MRKTVFSIVIFLVIIFISPVYAEIRTFIREYSYQASEYDSKSSARVLALEQVKRILLEELGIYLESETEVKNFQITRDHIIAYTAGIVRTEIIDEKWDGKSYYLKAKIQANPQQISNFLNDLRKNRQKSLELEKSRELVEELLQNVEILKKDLARLKNKKSSASKQKQKSYRLLVNSISALDWYNVGKFYSMNDSEYAIVAFNHAIELNPHFADAYVERGRLYLWIFDNNTKSMQDSNTAIHLEPKSSEALQLRAQVQFNLGNFDQALKDYNKAIEIKPDDSSSYLRRAQLNILPVVGKLDFHQAIKDYTKVIELSSDADISIYKYYFERGDIYQRIGDYKNALKDYDKGIDLGSSESQRKGFEFELLEIDRILKRGHIHEKLGNHQQAIRDYDQVIEYRGRPLPDLKIPTELKDKDPKTDQGNTFMGNILCAEPYYYRAELFDKLGQHERASKEFDKVFELRPIDGAFIKGEGLLKNGEYIESIQAVNRGIDLALPRVPNESNNILMMGHYFRSFVFKKLKNYQQALYEIDSAFQKTNNTESKIAFLLLKSNLYWELRNHEGAVICVDEAIIMDSSNPLLFKVRGIYHLLTKKYQKALSDFEQVIKIDQQNKTNNLGDLAKLFSYEEEVVWRFSFPVEQRKEIYESFKIFSKKYPEFKDRYENYLLEAKKFNPDSWRIKDSTRPKEENEWLKIGQAMFHNKNFVEAIEAFTKAIQQEPKSSNLYVLRGDVYFKTKSYRAAATDYEKAISLRPDEIKFYYKHADACFFLRDYEKMILDFDMILKKNQSGLTLLSRGWAYEQLGKYEQALADYDKSLSIFTSAEGYFYRGVVCIFLGKDFNRAIQDLDKSIDIFLQDKAEELKQVKIQQGPQIVSSIQFQYISEAMTYGQFPSPLHHFDESLAYFFRGTAYYFTGAHQKAIIDFDKTIENKQTSTATLSSTYYFRGLTYEQMGNQQQSIEDIKAAARFGSDDAKTYLSSKGVSW